MVGVERNDAGKIKHLKFEGIFDEPEEEEPVSVGASSDGEETDSNNDES